MRTFILTLLTTLFVGAMPLHAAYTPQPTGQTTLNLVDDKQACAATHDGIFTQEFIKKIVDLGGTIIDISDLAMVSDIREEIAQTWGPAPWTFDAIVFAVPPSKIQGQSPTHLLYFKEGCLVGEGTVPNALAYKYAKKAAKEIEQEKVKPNNNDGKI